MADVLTSDLIGGDVVLSGQDSEDPKDAPTGVRVSARVGIGGTGWGVRGLLSPRPVSRGEMEMMKVRTGCSRWIVAVLSALGVLGVGTAWSVVAAPPASAVACAMGKYGTSIDPSKSDVFAVPLGSDCVDLNAAYTYSFEDKIRGWYQNSSGWQAGSAGFVYVPTTDSGWKVLLTSVRDGTSVRGEGLTYSQDVQYVI